jgi:hypothetical protein
MNHDLADIEERVKRYWYTDGIAELSSGGMFTLLGVYFGIQAYLGEDSPVSAFLQVGLVLLMMAGAVSISRLVNTVKTRLTYPRTGFVEYHVNEQDARQRRYVVMTVAMIMLIGSILLIKNNREFDSMVLVIGILAGVVFVTLRGKSSGGIRFYILGAFSILLGVGLALSGLSQTSSLALFFVLLGIAVMVSGGLVLRRYLSKNPLPAGDENE